MTSKFKCPLCNHELYQTASECLTYCCLNTDCPSDFKFAGSKELWQALIRSQKDLAVTKDFLQKIRMFVHKGNEQELAKIALEQIEHKE